MNAIPMVSMDAGTLNSTLNGAETQAPAGPGARLRRDETSPQAALDLFECPLQVAMRQVAEAAVTQHVLYTEGVFRPREGLLHEMQAWMRLHELVRTGICPATRAGNAGGTALEPGDLEIALAGLPVDMRAKVAASIRVCGRRSWGEGCPLEAQPTGSLME